MNNLNIESLFNIKDEFKPHSNGTLDINTLFKKKDPKKFVFNSQLLLKTVQKKKETLAKCYLTIYEKCCGSIMAANSAGLTEIIYEVTSIVPECPEYTTMECLQIIQQNFKQEHIPSRIIPPTCILINWNNIENDPNINHDIKKLSEGSSE
jgi:hypothetical protein